VPKSGLTIVGSAIVGLLAEKSIYRSKIRPVSFQGNVRILYEPMDFMTLACSAGGFKLSYWTVTG